MSLGQVIGAIIFGYLSDKIGRKWLIVLGIIGYGLAQLGFFQNIISLIKEHRGEDIDIYKTLESRKYDVYYKKDMSYAIEAEPFDIVIMDIKGVGSSRQSKSGGLSLACEVKGRYPLKKVGCCSVSRINTIRCVIR